MLSEEERIGGIAGLAGIEAEVAAAPVIQVQSLAQNILLDDKFKEVYKIPSRKCNIYYTNNTDYCDEGLYNRTLEQNKEYRQRLLNKNRSNYENTLVEKLNIVIADQEQGNIGKCKISFDDWIEPIYNTTGTEKIPLKNTKNPSLNTFGPLNNWANCYKKIEREIDPNIVTNDFIKKFELGGNASNLKVVNSPFNDNYTYAGMAFNSLDLKNKCLTSGAYPISDMPKCILAFIIEDNNLKSIIPCKYNSMTGYFKPLNDYDSSIIFQKMMRTINYNNNLYLVSKIFNAINYVFEYDNCGRIKSILNKNNFKFEINMQYNDNNLLYVFDEDFNHKTYETIVKHRNKMKNTHHRQIYNKYNDIVNELNIEIKNKTYNILNQLNGQPISNIIKKTTSIDMNDPLIYSINPTASENTSVFYVYTYDFLEETKDCYDCKESRDDDNIENFENNISDDVRIIDKEFDITNENVKKSSPLNILKSIVKYSISLYLKIDSVSTSWRNIFYHGDGQSDNTMTGAVPSLSIYPNTSYLYFRHSSQNNQSNGCDLLSIVPDLGTWFHLTIVVDDNLISLYYNGVLVQRNTGATEITNGAYDKNDHFTWPNTISNINFYINYYNYKYNTISEVNTGSVKINHLIWYNKILSVEKIRKLGNAVNKLNNFERRQLSYDSLYSMITPFTFTSARNKGQYGPTYDMSIEYYNFAYNNNNNNNYAEWINNTTFYTVEKGIQIWTVPRDGIYNIIAAGACGSGLQMNSITGRGAIINSYFQLKKEQLIAIVIGQYSNKGAGGGTFIIDITNDSKPLLIAGGGGSGSVYINKDQDASFKTSGNPGTGCTQSQIDGNGGKFCEAGPNCNTGAGGGGFKTNGEGNNNTFGIGYLSSINLQGPLGGIYQDTTQQINIQNNGGGYGGGAGGTINNTNYFGGGGYTGGSGGMVCGSIQNGNIPIGAGGGGGSYDAANEQDKKNGIPYMTDGYNGYNNKDVKYPYLNTATNGSGFVTIQNIF